MALHIPRATFRRLTVFTLACLTVTPTTAKAQDLTTVVEILAAASAAGPHFYRLRFSADNPMPLLGSLQVVPDGQQETVEFRTCDGEVMEVLFEALEPSGARCQYERGAFHLTQLPTFSSESAVYAMGESTGLQLIGHLTGPSFRAIENDDLISLNAEFSPVAYANEQPIEWEFSIEGSDFVLSESGNVSLVVRDPHEAEQLFRRISEEYSGSN